MSSWQPSQEGLKDLLVMIEQSRSTDNKVQQQVKERIDLFHQVPDFGCYLAYILCTALPGVDSASRAISGYLLVGILRYKFQSLSVDVVNYLKLSLLAACQDKDADVRRAASNATSWLFRGLVPENWPQGLQSLMQLMESPSPEIQQTALSTFAKLCADIPKALERVQVSPDQTFLDFLVPALLQRMTAADPKISSEALNCLVPFIEPESKAVPSNALAKHIDIFISSLFKRASDPSPAVRKQVCTAMVALLSSRPAKIVPEINGVVDYVLHCTQDADRDLALEACEFWLTFAEDPELSQVLKAFIPRVAPVLLDATIYDDDELFALGALDDEDDSAVPDKPENIKPSFYNAKVHSQNASSTSVAPPEASTSKARGDSTTTSESVTPEVEEEEEEDDDEDFSEWTLRKCAAAALDTMATSYEADLLMVLLPHLKDKLQSSDWLQRESGILVLGAMAEGCIGHLAEHLPQLIPYLLSSLNDPKPLVRSIACWTIGRYSAWLISETASPEHKQQFFVPALEGLLRMLVDNNKKVQEAGCSGFATLEEEAGNELDPFLEPILRTLVFAFSKYQRKNLLILYDAIGTLADAVGESLNNEKLIPLLMPPLIEKWQSLEDDNEDIIPLLECMSSVVIAVSQGFAPYAQPVFERCSRIIHTSLVHYQTYTQNPSAYEMPEKTFIIVALDLLSGLTQGLGPSILPLYEANSSSIFSVMLFCLQYPDASVRQSAYALLGDCAISVFPLLKPYIPQIMPTLTQQVETEPKVESISVCNNAVWAAGEIALKLGTDSQPYIQPLMARLVPILLSPKVPNSLVENSAVTVGRFGFVCPQMVAPHLDTFMRHWCSALAGIKDNEEKDSAFRGICMAIQVNPNGLTKNFPFFLNAVARWQKPSTELNEMFRSILTGFKAAIGEQWSQMMASMPPPIQIRITERYGV